MAIGVNMGMDRWGSREDNLWRIQRLHGGWHKNFNQHLLICSVDTSTKEIDRLIDTLRPCSHISRENGIVEYTSLLYTAFLQLHWFQLTTRQRRNVTCFLCIPAFPRQWYQSEGYWVKNWWVERCGQDARTIHGTPYLVCTNNNKKNRGSQSGSEKLK